MKFMDNMYAQYVKEFEKHKEKAIAYYNAGEYEKCIKFVNWMYGLSEEESEQICTSYTKQEAISVIKCGFLIDL